MDDVATDTTGAPPVVRGLLLRSVLVLALLDRGGPARVPDLAQTVSRHAGGRAAKVTQHRMRSRVAAMRNQQDVTPNSDAMEAIVCRYEAERSA